MRFDIRNHSWNVASLAVEFCNILALPQPHSEAIVHAAYWHDVGKLAVPTEILNESNPLNQSEFTLIKQHTTVGARWLEKIGLANCADVALRHHERWDGSGYPDGLKGDAISLPARIVAICDVYAALREDRPYRAGLSHEEATEIVLRGDTDGRTQPSMFDPCLLEAFKRNHAALPYSVQVLQDPVRGELCCHLDHLRGGYSEKPECTEQEVVC